MLARLFPRPAWRVRLALGPERAIAWLRDTLDAEFAAGHGFLWLVACFGAGAAIYFNLPREPWPPALGAVALVLAGAAILTRRRGGEARLLLAATALVVGVLAGAVEARLVAAPRLDRERTVDVTGRVEGLETTQRGSLRLALRVETMTARGLGPADTPTRITATVNPRGLAVAAGDRVRFKARLKPPDGPVLPGGYDFARRAWFDGRGAYGYALGRVERLEPGERGLLARTVLDPVAELRHAIADRIRATLPGASGAIAAAMIVGEQRAIPNLENDWLRNSGLTHIVSISGLHMTLVAGGMIAFVRGLLALSPRLALRYPIKKWAAVAAFFASTVYLLLSGGAVAAMRSYLMLSVALLAVLLDRPAITQRTVAVTALFLLGLDPSNALDPSFLMSYLAVVTLVASYDAWRALDRPGPGDWRDVGLLRWGAVSALRHVEGLAFSSLIAGVATAPVIAQTFYRGAPYSLVANMVVLPSVGLVVMPAACLALLAMPFGLDPLPLAIMGLGIDYMVAVGRIVSNWPGGEGLIGAVHPWTAPVGVLAVLWLSFWRTRLRLFGILPAFLSLGLALMGPRPDLIVAARAGTIAIRGPDGRLAVLADRRDAFEVANFLSADGDPRKPGHAGLADGWTCDKLGCAYRWVRRPAAAYAAPSKTVSSSSLGAAAAIAAPADIVAPSAETRWAAETEPNPGIESAIAPAIETTPGPPVTISVVRDPRAFDEDCRLAAIVITALVAPPACADHALVIDRLMLARTGAVALDWTDDPRRPSIRTSLGPAPRPWTPIDARAAMIAAARDDAVRARTADPAIDPTAPDEHSNSEGGPEPPDQAAPPPSPVEP
ncbi:ComEC/Rec2 family competence protein [Methyloraptor flagellatus]|uniref:ComEC/Rec2 family competence protein n=1 Tax=Methyloraptor flagellatus TaxID=3162530 RepID=A0AAU7XHN3_9HYPH